MGQTNGTIKRCVCWTFLYSQIYVVVMDTKEIITLETYAKLHMCNIRMYPAFYYIYYSFYDTCIVYRRISQSSRDVV